MSGRDKDEKEEEEKERYDAVKPDLERKASRNIHNTYFRDFMQYIYK